MERDNRGAGRRGEPTPEQAGRTEHTQTPQQRGEGIRGVPPPEGEQAKAQQENPFSHKRYLEKMRTLYEKDPTLFATRAMEGLEALLEKNLPNHLESAANGREIVRTQARIVEEETDPRSKPLEQSRFIRFQYGLAAREGEIDGLKIAFSKLYECITGEPADMWGLREDELRKGKSSEGEGDPTR